MKWRSPDIGIELPTKKNPEWTDSTISTDGKGTPLVSEVTTSVASQVSKFAPAIYMVGYSRVAEVFSNYNAWFFRALKNKKGDRLCLQYIWVFLKQTGVLGSLWAFTLIPFALLWLLFLTLLYSPVVDTINQNLLTFGPQALLASESLFLVLVSLVLGIVTFLFGFVPFIQDNPNPSKWKSPKVRSSFILVIGGPVVSSWILSPIFAVSSMIILLFIVCFLHTTGRDPGSHEMDYTPVFVWLKWSSNDNGWEFEKAAWDSCHYKVGRYPVTSEVGKNKVDSEKDNLLHSNTRIRLEIESLWHDFSRYPEKRIREYHFFLSAVIAASGGLLAMPILSNTLILIFGNQYLVLAYLSILFLFVTLLFLTVAYIPVFYDDTIKGQDSDQWWIHISDIRAGYPYSWKKMTEDYFDYHYLSDSKLRYFWNFPSEKGKLEIISKMKNPFEDEDNWISWRDDK
ncbi:MAG: hypothetical protein ACXACA_07570 [Candidatus Ranarchaeia archaeon]|jgi:hypothetical protein